MEFEPENIPAEVTQLEYIESLLQSSTISEENKEYWYKRVNMLSYGEAENLIEFLEKKQVNRVLAGLNYNMGYVNWFLKKSI